MVDIGDWMDFKPPARWSKGTAAEFLGDLDRDLKAAHAIQDQVRAVWDGPWSRHLGNHDERVAAYVAKYAPALGTLAALDYSALLRHQDYDIKTLPKLHDIAPGWVSTHGHAGSLARYAGGTAIGLARSIGKSVVCGHTHRLGLIAETRGYNAKTSTLYGMEVGNLMDMKRASYLKSGAANWQAGFGLLHVNGTRVHPQPISMAADGSFLYNDTDHK